MHVHILVADDDPAVRESLRRSLTFNGYEVSLADDGRAALVALDSSRPTSSCSTSTCRTSTVSRCAAV